LVDLSGIFEERNPATKRDLPLIGLVPSVLLCDQGWIW